MIKTYLRLKSQFLGDKPERWKAPKNTSGAKTRPQIRRIVRDQHNGVQWPLDRWAWGLEQARKFLKLDVEHQNIWIPTHYTLLSVGMYRRQWKDAQGAHEEWFECAPKGTLIEFPVVVTDSLSKDEPRSSSHSDKPLASEQQAHDMINFIGSTFGMSPWGNNFGYGRFSIEVREV